MSIFGAAAPQTSLEEGVDLTSIRSYIDEQDGLRVLKAGDTMTGTLTIEPDDFNAIVATPSGGSTTTINFHGMQVSGGGAIGVGVAPGGGPSLNIHQRRDIDLTDGIRVRNAAGISTARSSGMRPGISSLTGWIRLRGATKL